MVLPNMVICSSSICDGRHCDGRRCHAAQVGGPLARVEQVETPTVGEDLRVIQEAARSARRMPACRCASWWPAEACEGAERVGRHGATNATLAGRLALRQPLIGEIDEQFAAVRDGRRRRQPARVCGARILVQRNAVVGPCRVERCC